MKEEDKKIEKEIKDGIIPDPSMIDPITGEPMAPGTEDDVMALGADGGMAPPLDGGLTNGDVKKDTKLAEI